MMQGTDDKTGRTNRAKVKKPGFTDCTKHTGTTTRNKHKQLQPGLVAFHKIRLGNVLGVFLQPLGLHSTLKPGKSSTKTSK